MGDNASNVFIIGYNELNIANLILLNTNQSPNN